MRLPVLLAMGALLAPGAVDRAAAQPAPTVAVQPDPIRIRLRSELGASAVPLASAIERSGRGTVSEPAQFEIVNDIVAEGAVQLRTAGISPIRSTIDPGAPMGESVTDPIGIVVLGDVEDGTAGARLRQVLPVLQWRARMIALSKDSSPPPGVVLCNADFDKPDRCADGHFVESLSTMFATMVRNRSSRPVEIALIHAYGDLTIEAADLAGGRKVVSLKPGQTLKLPVATLRGLGTHRDFLVVSDRPIDLAELADPTRMVAARPGLGVTQFTVDEYNIGTEPEPAMGGGYIPGSDDVDWIVEMFDTKPYTQAELDADKALGANSKRLSDRTPEERAHTCGGTMIGPNLVLTAAHCVATGRFKGPNAKDVFQARAIRVGSIRLGKGGAKWPIVGLAVHSGYTGEGAGLPNDIALLMVKPNGLSPRALKVASAPPPQGTTVTGLGWGYTKPVAPGRNMDVSNGEAQRNPSMLQAADMEVLAFPACQQKMGAGLKPGMVCLVTPKSRIARGGSATFSCRGDSGGPLVRNYAKANEELVGLTSWSLGCGYKDIPSVYTDVAYFSEWVAAARKAIKAGAVVRVADPGRAR